MLILNSSSSSGKVIFLASSLALILAIICSQHVQHVESANSTISPSSRFTQFKSRLNQFNFNNFRQQIRSRVGDLASRAFEVFTRTYNRTYTPEELGERLNVFMKRFAMIQSWNRDYLMRKVSYTMKLNHLADRSDRELSQLNGLKTPAGFNETTSKTSGRRITRSLSANYNIQAVPDSKDWRTSSCMTPIRNQGSCGCCYAVATVEMVGINYCLETNSAASRQPRSMQEVVDCGSEHRRFGAPHMNGCNGGWPLQNIQYLQEKQQLATEKEYPFRMRKQRCNSYATGLPVSRLSSGGPKYVQLQSESDFKEHIGKYGPVVAAIHATDRFQLYNSGLFDDSTCGARQWNHAVLVVGYGSEAGKDYWLIKNSYGDDWGEKGYMRMIRGKKSCKIGQMGWGLYPNKSGESEPTRSPYNPFSTRSPYSSRRPYRSSTARPSPFGSNDFNPFSMFFT